MLLTIAVYFSESLVVVVVTSWSWSVSGESWQ